MWRGRSEEREVWPSECLTRSQRAPYTERPDKYKDLDRGQRRVGIVNRCGHDMLWVRSPLSRARLTD